MDDPLWELIPKAGIECSTVKILFGAQRHELLQAMAKEFAPPVASSFLDEDDFVSLDKETFVRVRYQRKVVRDIEFLKGSLKHEGIHLHSGTTFPELERMFERAGLTFRDTQWLGEGQDCPELGINVATHEDVGGDGDAIEWVIMSSNFNDLPD